LTKVKDNNPSGTKETPFGERNAFWGKKPLFGVERERR